MLELGKLIAMLILIAGINLMFKDAASRRHYRNAVQSFSSDSSYYALTYDSLTIRK